MHYNRYLSCIILICLLLHSTLPDCNALTTGADLTQTASDSVNDLLLNISRSLVGSGYHRILRQRLNGRQIHTLIHQCQGNNSNNNSTSITVRITQLLPPALFMDREDINDLLQLQQQQYQRQDNNSRRIIEEWSIAEGEMNIEQPLHIYLESNNTVRLVHSIHIHSNRQAREQQHRTEKQSKRDGADQDTNSKNENDAADDAADDIILSVPVHLRYVAPSAAASSSFYSSLDALPIIIAAEHQCSHSSVEWLKLEVLLNDSASIVLIPAGQLADHFVVQCNTLFITMLAVLVLTIFIYLHPVDVIEDAESHREAQPHKQS